uniref:Zinc finger protein 644a n=1 Tax=Nothobranchius furzeri TaxID=105023 RepID=A0A1A8UP54_NOTFU
MEMSCVTGVDEDEKDADSEVSTHSQVQRHVMAQDSASCTSSFGKSSLNQSIVLDVLSSTDILSPVGLENGPSLHQATQDHEFSNISSEKEEEKSITPLKTVQEIDNAGIWGFDIESPENSLDNFSSANDLDWDPHKEFMRFLWENHDSPGEEPKEEVSTASLQRRRKRKMDMVVMVDPSEDLYPNPSPKSSDDSSDVEGQEDSSPIKVRNSHKLSTPQPSPTENNSKFPNGSINAMNDIFYKSPKGNSHKNSINNKLSSVKGGLAVNSHSEKRSFRYPCSKCKLTFKKEHRLLFHMKSHEDPPSFSPKPFMCRECGQSFKESSALIDHMSIHEKKRIRLREEVKEVKDRKKEEKNKMLFCPQCSFGTSSPNTFVQHAKTHEKDKRIFSCDKCSFRSQSAGDLKKHDILQHTVITVKKQIQSKDSEIFPCAMCSYKAFGEQVFQNHLMLRHQMTLNEYIEVQHSEKDAPPSRESSPVEDSGLTSKLSIQNQTSSQRDCLVDESGSLSDLFENSKVKRSPKSQVKESKLDKSINVLLSRQSNGKKTAEQKNESNNCIAQNSKNSCDGSTETMSVKVEYSDGSLNGPKLNIDKSSVKKSPSKRKMSTPYRNTSEQDSCFDLPRSLPSPNTLNQEDAEDCDETEMFPGNDSESSSNHFDSGIKKERKHIIYTYSRRMSMRGALQASKKLFEKIKTEEQELNDPEIKEESIETEVFQENFESHQIPLGESPTNDLLELDTDGKNCPYCPAIFESGVGLSNHVRGHLHRVGLSYNARHVVPPEQVAYQDRRPRIRRRFSAIRRLRKALQLESDSETVTDLHTCPLCGDAFDNRTGQSNHIRGHLKKLGKNFASKSKSPIILLHELMRDKKEFQQALQILGRRRNHFHYGASPKLPITNRFTSSQTRFPKSHSIPSVLTDTKPLMPTFTLSDIKSENGQLEKMGVKNSLSGTTALIGILKKRKCQEDARLKGSTPISRNESTVSSNSEHSSGSLPNSPSEKGEFNRKMCIHCNATFHSGVALSNHLRAYAKRKRIALQEGTTVQCRAVRQRSRSCLKKKTLPLPQSPEEMYRLTCRFCDLVFQGPLSVQEDWIKHLQRHIMNTGVPHTGLGMLEVSSLPTAPPSVKTDQDSCSAAPHVAS